MLFRRALSFVRHGQSHAFVIAASLAGRAAFPVTAGAGAALIVTTGLTGAAANPVTANLTRWADLAIAASLLLRTAHSLTACRTGRSAVGLGGIGTAHLTGRAADSFTRIIAATFLG